MQAQQTTPTPQQAAQLEKAIEIGKRAQKHAQRGELDKAIDLEQKFVEIIVGSFGENSEGAMLAYQDLASLYRKVLG